MCSGHLQSGRLNNLGSKVDDEKLNKLSFSELVNNIFIKGMELHSFSSNFRSNGNWDVATTVRSLSDDPPHFFYL